jgi:VCBS repeat-containing protein
MTEISPPVAVFAMAPAKASHDAVRLHGKLSTTSQIAVDRAPIANPDTGTAVVGTLLSVGASGGVLANDTDLDADALTVATVGDTASGAGAADSALAGVYGHLTLNADGSYSYTAVISGPINSAPPGSLLHDTFSYSVS